MTERIEVHSPYEARSLFLPLHKRSTRWAITVAHRRAGKTVACVNELIMGALSCRLPRGRFAYVAPQLNQAKDIAWSYLKEHSRFVPGMEVRETELQVRMPGAGRIRIYGADNPDRFRGLYLDGVVLDEYGDMDPKVWTQVIRPTLSDRKGWACFIGTPKGNNHFHQLWSRAENDPDWLRLMLKASETGLIDAKELADARRAMSDDDYAQEFECSFDAAVRGAYYAPALIALEQADPAQITHVPHEPALEVHTAWDLGMSDSTVIWFVQVCGGETRVIDVLKGEGVGLEWYANQLKDRPALHGHAGSWVWGNHYLPHDSEVRELGTGKTRIERLAEYGIGATICPNIPPEDGIQAVRALLPTCWFDKERCKAGLEALRMYRREWDPKAQEFRAHPLHDWTSHYADAFRYFAVGHRPRVVMKPWRRDNRWVV